MFGWVLNRCLSYLWPFWCAIFVKKGRAHTAEVYLELFETSIQELYCENIYQLKANFRQKATS